MENLLSVENLQISFSSATHTVYPVEEISFHIKPGETLGIVGESGCGKSITALSIMRLIKKKNLICRGKILYDGVNLLELSESEMCLIRGNQISMIFQEPMTSLNPLFSIGAQVVESIRLHKKISKKEAREQAIEAFCKVKIPRAEKIMDEYPHTLSGGMQQRVMIAMALVCQPGILIADEPTTALDVTIQAQILELIRELQEELGMALILITHDLGIVAEMVDRVMVVYAGLAVEEGTVFDIFDRPYHPYTRGLINSIPGLRAKNARLESIPGTVPSLYRSNIGCRFYERCRYSSERCSREGPLLSKASPTHKVRCWKNLVSE